MQEKNVPEGIGPEQILPKKSKFTFYLALILFVGVISGGIGISLQNLFLLDKIENIQSNIAQEKKKIDELSLDRTIIISKIERSNTIRPSIDLAGIINDFKAAASRANVRLKGFSISNDVISTTLISTTPDIAIHPDAAGTIIKMMREYAEGRGGRFSLEPITSISGDLKMRSTGIQLKVLSQPIK